MSPTGRAERLDLPAAEFAVLVHEGPFADLDRTYGALGTHVALQRIGVDGPIREHYVVAGADVDRRPPHRGLLAGHRSATTQP